MLQNVALTLGVIIVLAFVKFFIKWGYIILPENSKRIGYIDGVRGYLAFAVFIVHFNVWTLMYGHSISMASPGMPTF